MSQPPSPPALPRAIYATLAGIIDQAMVQRVFQGLALATAGGVRELHVLMQSTGGVVGDGIALYNYLRTFPFDLHLYNGGNIASIAVLTFLGAPNRYASAHATFMAHRTYASTNMFGSAAAANTARLREVANALEIDDARTRRILIDRLNITDQVLDDHLIHELPFTATEALQCGLITAIREFTPPAGQGIFNI